MPRTDVLPCRVGHLLGESQLPFDPTDGTEEGLAKEFTLWDYKLETEIVMPTSAASSRMASIVKSTRTTAREWFLCATSTTTTTT